jgi:FkbM family methyltransferase
MINLTWLEQNFNKDLTIFDIGAAGLHSGSTEFRSRFPDSKIYSFECNDFWITGENDNFKIARDYGIHYFHVALFDSDDTKIFMPSNTSQGVADPYSGSFFEDLGSHKTYHPGVSVETMRVDTFCKNFKVRPDFIHIDVEGAEYYILKCLGEYKPKAIWAEIQGFDAYPCGVTFEAFNEMMTNQEYNLAWKDDDDGLYLLQGNSFTEYNF